MEGLLLFDIWVGDIELTTAVLLFSVVVLIPLQLLLCFKGKNGAVRLLPVTVLGLFTLLFLYLSVTARGWDGLGYMVLAIFGGIMLLACGVGWGIWAIIRRKERKKDFHG